MADSDSNPIKDFSTGDYPSQELIAASLSQYEVGELVDASPDCHVYWGRQSFLDRTVMIEVIPEPAAELQEAMLDRLRRRVRMVHPSIAALYDFGQLSEGPFYLVAEHVDGSFLSELLEQDQLKPKAAFPLALQICEALQKIHDLDTAHGTLTLQTILVTKEGTAKLTSIGMGQKPDGVLSWGAPFHGNTEHDMVCLGHVLHWMFAKSAPERYGRLSRDIPPAFAGVISRCIERNTGRQLARPEDAAAALRDALRVEQEKSASAPASPGKMPTYAPPKAPEKTAPAPVEAPPRRSFFQWLDSFVWRSFKTILYIVVPLIFIGCVVALVLFKGRIVIETQEQALPAAAHIEEVVVPVEPPPPPTAPVEPVAPIPEPEKPMAESAPTPTFDPWAELRTQYLVAVQNAANEALERVKLDELPFLQKELLLLQSGGEIPAVDEADLPASLKVLRQRYRDVRAGKALLNP